MTTRLPRNRETDGHVDPSALEALAHGVVMASFAGPRPPAWLLRRVGAGLGSVCLFGSNLPRDEQDDDHVRELTDRLHAVGPTLLVAIDEETGDVTRLDAGRGSPWPGAAALGAAGSPDLTCELHHDLGARLAACGIDLDLAPVADVNSDPANPVIGVRSFGARGGEVAAHVAAAVQGLRHGGVAACVKHFPGHGDTRTDSHRALAVLDVPADVLAARAGHPVRREQPPTTGRVNAYCVSVSTFILTTP
jgi:beta-N-acetylhexosaminidase